MITEYLYTKLSTDGSEEQLLHADRKLEELGSAEPSCLVYGAQSDAFIDDAVHHLKVNDTTELMLSPKHVNQDELQYLDVNILATAMIRELGEEYSTAFIIGDVYKVTKKQVSYIGA